MKGSGIFKFKHFDLHHGRAGQKVTTDSILLGAWATVEGVNQVLDVGAGTGLLSLMVAQRNLTCNITAIEPDEDSILDLEQNIFKTDDENRMEVVHSDIAAFEPIDSFDLVICNPPYFDGLQAPEESRNNARQNADSFWNGFLSKLPGLLSENGHLSIILPQTEWEGRQKQLAAKYNCHRICEVSHGEGHETSLVLSEWRSQVCRSIKCQELELYKGKSLRKTEAFYDLTKEFYLHK